MKNMPSRDITGQCVGECKDIVGEADQRRQQEINAMKIETPESYPTVSGSFSRNEAPGFLGGHV